jgi:hypothetical protein
MENQSRSKASFSLRYLNKEKEISIATVILALCEHKPFSLTLSTPKTKGDLTSICDHKDTIIKTGYSLPVFEAIRSRREKLALPPIPLERFERGHEIAQER